MAYLYNTLIYYPILNALVYFYETIAFHDLGISIILVTILIRAILYPVFQRSMRHQMVVQKIKPELDRINKLHKDDREKQMKETMALWRAHGTNPFSGIALTLVQLPILIALYQIFIRSISSTSLEGLYSFIPPPGELHKVFLGLLPLDKQSNLMVGVVAVLQYLQGRSALPAAGGTNENSPGKKDRDPQQALARNMVLIGPVVTLVVFILLKLPNAVSLYWAVSTAVTIGQQLVVRKQLDAKGYGEPGTIHKNTH